MAAFPRRNFATHPFRLRQRLLRWRQPERHVHRTVDRNSGRESSASLLPLADCGIQRPEAAVAVRLERAHPQLVGQREGLAERDGIGRFVSHIW